MIPAYELPFSKFIIACNVCGNQKSINLDVHVLYIELSCPECGNKFRLSYYKEINNEDTK